MTELSKDKALATADLAGAGPALKVPEFPGPPLRREREYVEEPRVKGPSRGPAAETTPLFAADETEHLRSDWSAIQSTPLGLRGFRLRRSLRDRQPRDFKGPARA